MASNEARDYNQRTASTNFRDCNPRIPDLTPVAGGNLGQTANDGLLPFGVERDEEREREETDE